MARPKIEGVPTLSLIDRLSLADSDSPSDGPFTLRDRPGDTGKIHYRDVIRRYKDSVKRDLEWLLNTRRVFDDRVDDFPELSTSVFAYGLPDISSVNVGSTKDQNRLLRLMEKSLEIFDHRLKDIHIEFEPSPGGVKSLQFKISGILLMDPAPEEILIDTVLDSTIGKYEVK